MLFRSVKRNDAISVEEVLSRGYEGVILSPGPCAPDDAGICLDLVRQAPDTLPVLGVCLGHQAIGQAFGGAIVRAPEPLHGKLSRIETNNTGVFQGLPKNFEVTRYHSLAIDPPTLPDCLIANAWSVDGCIMGVHHIDRPIHGVQFHPESIASQHGHQLLGNFLKIATAGNLPNQQPKALPERRMFAQAGV